MPEIYADWKSLQPLTEPVPVGTKCVVIENKYQGFSLGAIVVTEQDEVAITLPMCSDGDLQQYVPIEELALLPADYQADQPAPTKPERKVVQISANNLGVAALCSDGAIWWYSNICGDWQKLPPIPQD